MATEHLIIDKVGDGTYGYVTRDDKEETLFEALQMSLEDKCPPDTKDYVCLAGEDEEQDCINCWLRWATKDYKRNYKPHVRSDE